MATGWLYSHEDGEWYYLNEDGTRKTGWLNTGGVWYWLDSNGVLYDDGWRMVDGHKYYFTQTASWRRASISALPTMVPTA